MFDGSYYRTKELAEKQLQDSKIRRQLTENRLQCMVFLASQFYMAAAPCIGNDKGSFHTHARSFCTPETHHGLLLCIPTPRYSDKYYSWPSCIQRVFIPDQTVDETPISCFINQSKRMIRRKPSRPVLFTTKNQRNTINEPITNLAPKD